MKSYKLTESHSYEEIDAAPAPAAAQSAFRPPPEIGVAIIVLAIGFMLCFDRLIRRTGRALAAACLAAACLLLSGCVSKDKIDSGAKWAKNYYEQPNTAEILHIEGSNVLWTVSGATRITLSTPVPPKSVIPASPRWYDSVADVAKTVAPWFFMAWAVDNGAIGSRSTTINNAAPAQ